MLSGIMICLLLVLFLGIVGWAYDRDRRDDFDAAAMLPLRADAERKPAPWPRSGASSSSSSRPST